MGDVNSCPISGCFHDRKEESDLPNRLVGFSYMYDRTKAIGLLGGDAQMFGTTEVTINDLRAAAQKLCSMAPTDAKARFTDCIDSDKWQNFCGDATYIVVLLENGFGFDPSMTLTMANKINGIELVWTLGAIIAKSDNLPIREHPASQPQEL